MGNQLYLERFVWFDHEARRERYPNAFKLGDHFEISVKTAQRSIDHFRDRLIAPLEYDKSRRTLANQLLRSGTSIGANVEEGQGSQSRADFIAKYSIACKEARETHYWLRLLAACEIVQISQLDSLIEEVNQIVAILTSIVIKCRANNLEKRKES